MNNLENFKDMDSFILLSIINLKLRDFYSSLEGLCDDLNINSKELESKLKEVGYVYNRNNNQFIAK